MRLWLWLGLSALAVFTLLAYACGGDDDATPTPAITPTPSPTAPPGTAGPGVTDGEIHLGMTNDVGGSGETPYAAVSQAAQAYFRKVNQEDDGACGRQIVFTVKDDEYSPELALELTQELVEEDDVLAIIGALSTQAHKDVAAYLNDPDDDGETDDGVPDLFVSTGWSGWGNVEQYPWTTGFIPDYLSDGRALAQYITSDLEAGTVGLLYRDDEFGQDYLTAFEEAFDGGVLFTQPYPPDDDDVSDEMGAVLDSGADIIALASTPEISAAAITVAEDAEYDGQFLLSYVNQPSNLASDLGGGSTAEEIIQGFQQLDGVLASAYLLSAVENENNTAVVEHVRIMETFDGPTASSLSIYGQALAETVVETLERSCPDLTREGVLAAAESLDGFHPSLLLPGIEVVLSEDDHLALQALQIVRINSDGTLLPRGNPVDTGPQATPR